MIKCSSVYVYYIHICWLFRSRNIVRGDNENLSNIKKKKNESQSKEQEVRLENDLSTKYKVLIELAEHFVHLIYGPQNFLSIRYCFYAFIRWGNESVSHNHFFVGHIATS